MSTMNKLDNHNYAQAHIVTYDDGTRILVSYQTPVIHIDPQGWLTCYGLFSATTRKHISWFIKQLGTGLSYQSVKECYLRDYEINIHTGEIRDIDDSNI